jgi:hypothetical protein
MRQGRMTLPPFSAYHPMRIGYLHTFLVGKYLGWGAFGEPSMQMDGI